MLKTKILRVVALFIPAISFSTSFSTAQAEPTSEADLLSHIEILASDEYEGRFPGTAGETKTLTYLSRQWAEAGLVSGTEDAEHPWFQPVNLVDRKPYAQVAQFRRGASLVDLPLSDIVLRSNMDAASAFEAPMVFAGYGVDGEAAVATNVAGKIAVIRYSEPEFAPEEADSATGKDTDTFGIAERRKALMAAGAKAVLAILDDGGFTIESLKKALQRRSISLASEDHGVALDGFVSKEFAARLLQKSGSSIEAMYDASTDPDFTGLDLPVAATLMVTMQENSFTSHNVIGKLPGKRPGHGAVMLMGHWDHLGICRDEETADRICNGAVDNASGIAVLTEAAKRLAAGPALDRDVYIMGTTAEEQGLLGAYSYAEHPAFPLSDIVVALNVDTVAIAPRGAKVAIVGRGETELDSIVDTVGRELGREVETSTDANAFIQRQDGWALAKQGVPTLMAGGSFADISLLEEFLGGDYHQPGDEVGQDLELGGAADDTDLHVALTRYFASLESYPADSH